MSVQAHALAASYLGKEFSSVPLTLLYRCVGGPQSRSGRFEGKKKSLASTGKRSAPPASFQPRAVHPSFQPVQPSHIFTTLPWFVMSGNL
jgi:hypothetical protein